MDDYMGNIGLSANKMSIRREYSIKVPMRIITYK